MAKEEITPSEWQIMEVLWACGEPLTSSEVYKRMQGNVDMSMRMVRVLMNRLNQKDVLGYTVDEHDSRVYHYYVQKTREECVKEKRRKFVDSYSIGDVYIVFGGFYKLPDLVSRGNSCLYETGSDVGVIQIPYENKMMAGWRNC